MYLEIIATTLSEARAIDRAGADRIELLSCRGAGGVTPSYALIDRVSKAVDIPVQVMLRPHADSFVYDAADRQVLFDDLAWIRKSRATGIVFGALQDDGGLDLELLDAVIANKGALTLTFHRALDHAADYERALDSLLDREIDTILTAGGADSVMDGIERLKRLRPRFESAGVELLAGSGLTPDNLERFVQASGIDHVHLGSAARRHGRIDENAIQRFKQI